MKSIILVKSIIFYILLILNLNAAQPDYFKKGKLLFDKNQIDKSKILFEKDIVFNPRSENSYLYLAKIFNKKENEEEEEINLNNVLLINPKNDEALYMLAILKINKSDYQESKKIIEKFSLVCKSFCSKKDEMEEKLNKLIPENVKE